MKRLEHAQAMLAQLRELASAEDGRRLARLLFGGSSVLYACRPAPDYTATFVSPNVERLFGWAAQQMTGEPRFWLNRVHSQDLPAVDAALAQLAANDSVTYQYRFRHADGGWRWVEDEAVLWRDGDGGIVEITGAVTDISELRTARARLEDAIESLDDAFTLFDADDRLVLCNSRFRDLYPLVAEAIRPGVRFEDLIRLSAARSQHDLGDMPADEWVAQRMAHHRAGGRLYQRLSDGRHLDIRERRTSDGGTVGIRRDVTDIVVMEMALREALAFEQALIDSLPIPVYYKVPDGRYLAVNKAFEEAMGAGRESILGRTNFDFMRPDYAESIRKSDEALLASGGCLTYETRMVMGDGREHDLLVNKAVFRDSGGKVRGWVGSLVDVTEMRRTEERLLQAAKLATLGQIASEVAHELNQPLSIMQMALDNLRDRLGQGLDALPAYCAEPLGIAARQIARMADIVNHLRVYSRAEQQEARPFSPVAAVASGVRLMAPQLEAVGIRVTLDAPSTCSPALGKTNSFEQVLINLLSNARDAILARRQASEARRIAVRVWESPRNGTICVTVEDNGGGVPEALWDRIYEPFYTTKGESQGTGLGLSISSDILRQMGGMLSGENTADGARFCITVPVLPACPPPAEQRPDAATPRKTVRLRILVVDDEPEAGACMAEFLDRRGHAVTVATTGQEAIRRFGEAPCDLLISDLRMPHLSGAELAHRLRSVRADLPVILMTGQVDITAGEMERQGFLLVRKPISLAELDRLIQDIGDD